ncbi:MAG: ATP-grasp domain-containing protein [Flavobacteriales bacterium]|nr:ATP-grasp domain-containing protein [Flavobacteriales bacterium]
MKILVTGCGGDIGQSIGKILNEEKRVTALLGCDMSDKNAGKFIFDNFFTGLPVKDPKFLSSLENTVQSKGIDAIIPISEYELRYFSHNGIREISGVPIICANEEAMKVGFDKLATARFLESHDMLFPETNIISDSEPKSFPLIAKARTGSGSQDIYTLKDQKDFLYVKDKYPNFITQEFLSSDLGEFTCGLFRSPSHGVRSLIFKRELMGGFSGYGEVIENELIENFLKELAEKIELRGSINVQLRLTEKGPFVFEINPRFSSTVLFRHMFGFKDLIWSLEDTFGWPTSTYDKVKAGRKFYKGFSEYID